MDAIPHLAMPIAIVVGRYVSNQQGTSDEVAACVAVICSFTRGDREDDPDFGVLDPSFDQQPLDVADLQATCETYEPRAVVRVEESPYMPTDPLASRVTIAVSVLQTEDV